MVGVFFWIYLFVFFIYEGSEVQWKVMESVFFVVGFLYWVGVGIVVYLVLCILYLFFMVFWVWGVGNEVGVGLGFGEWVVVIGSIDGIGKLYVEELVKYGMKVVFISRLKDKFDQVFSEIKEKFKVEIRIIVVDFVLEDIYDKIKIGLVGFEIGILVNNVGMLYEYFEYFLDVFDLDNVIKKMININIFFVCKMI